MKNLLITTGLVAFAATGANAQAVLGYSLSQSAGSFAGLSSPVTVFDGAACDGSDFDFLRYTINPDGIVKSGSSARGFDVGFDIDYCGTKYSSFLVNPSGYIILGNGDVDFASFMGPNFPTFGQDFTIIGFKAPNGESFDANTRVEYSTTGTGDDSRLVVSFTGLLFKVEGMSETVPVDVQFAVKKNGEVSYVLKNFGALTDAEKKISLSMILRKGGDYVVASGDSGSLEIARNNNQATALFSNTTADGTTVTFNIPEPCVTPAAQPTALQLESTTTKVDGSFTAVSGADTYLVTYAPKGETVSAPVDGTTYKKGDALGAAKVAAFGSETEFETLSLDGSKDYTFTVYAANSYGLDGPKYNTVSPLAADVLTKPAPAEGVAFSDPTVDSFKYTVTSNEVDDEVVVLYNSYCKRDNYGDHGLFGEIPADVKAGDVLPVPEDFKPAWDIEDAPQPENAGTVAYVGKVGATLTLTDLKPSTGYYFAVYTRDSQGNLTTKPLYTGFSTTIENPYDGNTFNFPRYRLPFGWSGSEDSDTTYAFSDKEMWNNATSSARQGTQPIQQCCRVSKGDGVNGKEAWMVPSPVLVNDRHLMARFDYSITAAANRFSNVPYNDWAEGDLLEIQVSEDNGETWTAVASYNPSNNPKQEELTSYVSIAADLNAYRGKTVLLRYYWKTFSTAGFGTEMTVDCFSLLQAEFPAVPELTAGDVTDNSAVISWVSKQTDYELVYQEKGADSYVTVTVKDAKSYTLTGLKAETEYKVKVRGVLADDETGEQTGFSEWSDVLSFTTAGYPAAEAPADLKSDTETLKTLGYVILDWGAVPDVEKYEVAYRLASSTEWTAVESTLPTLMLTTLEADSEYVWKVRAYCTHSRVSDYSAQARFTTPAPAGVDGVADEGVTVSGHDGYLSVEGAEADVYSLSGTLQASGVSGNYYTAPGVYVVVAGTRSYKVAVR